MNKLEKILPIRAIKSQLRYTKKNIYRTIQRIISQESTLEYICIDGIEFPNLRSFIDISPPYFDTNCLRWTPTLGVKGRIFKIKDITRNFNYLERWHRHGYTNHTAECYKPRRPKLNISIIFPTTTFTIDKFLALLLLSHSQVYFTKYTKNLLIPADPLEAIFWRNRYYENLQSDYEFQQMMQFHFKGKQGCLSYVQSQIKPIFLKHKRYRNYINH